MMSYAWFDLRRPIRVATRLVVLSIVVCAGTTTAQAARPMVCGKLIRPQDTIWLISTRQSRCSQTAPAGAAGLRYYRFESPNGTGPARWQSADGAAFLNDRQPGGMTLFFVHGNRVRSCEAYRRGLAFYHALVRHAQDDRPLHFVTWSWPTARLPGLARDVRVKAHRTTRAGWQLAWLVDQMDVESSIGMVGFSFGARVITGALHVLGGGQLDRTSWPVRPPTDRGRIRTVLMTAALDDDWLLPGHYHGLALSQVERMLLLNNSCDPAMRWYHMIDRCRRPTALGRWGIPSSWLLGADAPRIDQWDVGSQIGQVHSFQSYLGCPHLMRQTWRHLSCEPHFAEHLHGGTDRSVE
jgi:hypothetical protein